MDEVSHYNAERWRKLAEANALFTRPLLDLTPEAARERMGWLYDIEDVKDKRVLLLCGGGGQQSAAFGLCGADVTVFDLSPEQLERDRQVAAHYNLTLDIQQGDMRDLSRFEAATFDIVDHPYALNFVPDCRAVFAQVARVTKPGSLYRVMCANPLAAGMTERDWNGTGYTIRRPYVQGEQMHYQDQDWVHGGREDVPPPQEFRQTLSTVINGLIQNGFMLVHFQEIMAYSASAEAEPGTWDHFTAIVPPWLMLYGVKK